MNDTNQDQELIAAARATFDDSVARLDATALSRLKRSRQLALSANRPSERPARRTWLPVAGAAAAAAAMLAVLMVLPEQAPTPDPVDSDVDWLFGEETLEVVEDLEFYYWMDQVSANVAGDA